MKCEEFGRYLDNYESLTNQEKTEMTDHAAMCEKCQEELDFFLAMLATTKSLPKIEPPADFMDMLNTRLDAEDKKPSKIAYHVRKNWKQYVTLAACFALVAVITSNRGILLDRIEGTEDGVITEETVEPGGNAAPDVTDEEHSVNETVAEAPIAEAAEETPSEPVTVAQAITTPAARAEASAPAQRTQKNVSAPAVNTQTSTPTQTAPAEKVTQETVSSPSELPVKNNSGDDYGIALQGTIQSIAPTEVASIPYDMTVEEVSASLRASKIIDSYSLAEGGDSIALGRYYSIDVNGKPIMNETDNAPTAIGSLRISSDDAEKAMDVLKQYPHVENGNVYTTGSENVSRILSDLNDEGVTYKDYIAGGSDDVKFKIEFN